MAYVDGHSVGEGVESNQTELRYRRPFRTGLHDRSTGMGNRCPIDTPEKTLDSKPMGPLDPRFSAVLVK